MTQLPAGVPTELFIGGVWRDGSSAERFVVQNPATASTLAEVASATADDAVAALDAAVAAQESWSRTPPRRRAELLRAGFEAVTARADDFALLMTLEDGQAAGRVPR